MTAAPRRMHDTHRRRVALVQRSRHVRFLLRLRLQVLEPVRVECAVDARKHELKPDAVVDAVQDADLGSDRRIRVVAVGDVLCLRMGSTIP